MDHWTRLYRETPHTSRSGQVCQGHGLVPYQTFLEGSWQNTLHESWTMQDFQNKFLGRLGKILANENEFLTFLPLITKTLQK